MNWKYDPLLCCYESDTEIGKYLCVRTFLDISKLYFNGQQIGTWCTGSHNDAIVFAEKHYRQSREYLNAN